MEMDEAAKLELGHQVDLYQFYIGSYIKGLAFYIAVTGALLKFALDEMQYRRVFTSAGLVVSMAALIPIVYAIFHQKVMKQNFTRLATATSTTAINTGQLQMLIIAAFAF